MNAEPDARHVRSIDDVLTLMDFLFEATADRWTPGAGGQWWDSFYDDRTKPVPFFEDKPDENLVSYLDRGLLTTGRVLDLGCGPGRNALHLAGRGFDVDGIDLSRRAVQWARERAERGDHTGAGGGHVAFHHGDAFGSGGAALTGPYELVYDSGCLHHLPPHRRVSYRRLLDRVLAPGGLFGLACFASPAMGTTVPDEHLYLRGGLEGGLAFTPGDLRWLFSDLEVVEIRPMQAQPADAPLFGQDFLLTGLFRRPA
ncbi:class I SAM-dependent methyltransferase [Kineococcus endophyticus]